MADDQKNPAEEAGKTEGTFEIKQDDLQAEAPGETPAENTENPLNTGNGTPPAEETPAETPAEELKVEPTTEQSEVATPEAPAETPAEPAAEEAPAETPEETPTVPEITPVAEETPAEETPAEPAAEETPAEEAPAEETPTEPENLDKKLEEQLGDSSTGGVTVTKKESKPYMKYVWYGVIAIGVIAVLYLGYSLFFSNNSADVADVPTEPSLELEELDTVVDDLENSYAPPAAPEIDVFEDAVIEDTEVPALEEEDSTKVTR